MNEEGNGFNRIDDIKLRARRLRYQAEGTVRELNLKLDKDARHASKLLGELAPALGFLTNPINLPKIIEVKAGGKEYVSIRRVEGPAIQSSYTRIDKPAGEDRFETHFVASIPKDFLAEGQILIFDRSSTTDLDCKDPDVEIKIVEKVSGKLPDFSNFTYLAMMSECPELFKEEEWEPSSMDVTMVTKRGGKIYSADIYWSSDEEYAMGNFTKINPTKEGKIEFEYAGYFQSPEDLSANQNYLRKFSRMYVLTEGSSEKESRRTGRWLTELKPSSISV